MAKPRVHEVAKELGLSSKEVLAHLEQIGQPAKSHSSSIDEELAARVRSELGNGAAPAEPAAAPEVKAPVEAPPPAKAETEAPAKPTPAAAKPEPAAVAEPEPEPVSASAGIRVHRGITVKDFAEALDRSPAEIVKKSLTIAGELCIYTNLSHIIETLD